jgi:hypothetical protein
VSYSPVGRPLQTSFNPLIFYAAEGLFPVYSRDMLKVLTEMALHSHISTMIGRCAQLA